MAENKFKGCDNHSKVNWEADKRKVTFGTPIPEYQHGSRLLRAKALGIIPLASDTSFDANQSFPRYLKYKHDYTSLASSRRKLPRVLKADDLHGISFASNVAEPPDSPYSSITTEDVSVPSDSWFVSEELASENFRTHNINPQKAILTINLKTNKILTTNNIALELLHYTAEDFLDLNLADLIVRERGQPAVAETLLSLRGNTITHSGKVVDVLQKNGDHIAMSLWLSRIKQPDCEDLCIAALEPVERLITQLNIDCEGRIIAGNETAAALFHFKEEDFSGRHLSCLMPKVVIPNSSAEARSQQTVGVTYHGEMFPLSIQFKSHDEIVYDENDSVADWAAFTAVITVYAHFSGLIIISDKGEVVDANTCFVHLAFGYDRADLIGKDLTEFLSPFDWKVPTPGAEFLHKDTSLVPVGYELQKSYETPDGIRHCVWISCSVFYLENWNNSMVSSLPSYSDISVNNDVSLGSAVVQKAKAKTGPVHLMHSCNCTIDSEDIAMIQGEYGAHYELVRHIGRGGFGCVKLAFRKSDRLLVVTKFIRKCRYSLRSFVKDKDSVAREVPLEIHLMKNFKHPNIVSLLDIFENEDYYQISMEKHGSGLDLFEFVERKPAMDEPLASYICRQLISAVDYLHSLNIVHRDIKDENVIINHEFHIKLIDFGAAAYFEPDKKFTLFFGTEQFGCPEGLRGRAYSGPEADVWALGVTFYVMMYEELPFGNVDESIAAVLDPPYKLSEDLMLLLREMLRRAPEDRITIPALRVHRWVNQPVNVEDYDFYGMMQRKPPSRDVSLFYQTPNRSKVAGDVFKVPIVVAEMKHTTPKKPLDTLPLTSTPCRKQINCGEDESVSGDSFLTDPELEDSDKQGQDELSQIDCEPHQISSDDCKGDSVS